RDADAHLLAAQYSAMLGRQKDALRYLDFSLHTGVNDPETLYFAAIIHNQLGNRTEAISFLQAAIRRGYSMAEIQHTPELSTIKP
ncbi:MAG: hypothetical protein DMG79_06925, partial [Acidobacteria bacterium]